MTQDPAQLIATVLELHERARGAALDAFQEQAFEVLHRLIRFDTAIWGLGADASAEGAFINSFHLHRIDAQMMREYEAAKGTDFIGATVAAALGRTHHFCIRDAKWSGAEHAPTVRHAIKWGMEHVLCTAVFEPHSGHKSFISLYRGDAGDRFEEAERRLVEELMPHLSAAFIANRAWSVSRLEFGSAGPQRAAALVDRVGGLHDASDAFRALLRFEWPQWRGGSLPGAITAWIRTRKPAKFRGERITCEALGVGDLMLLYARRVSALDTLTPRELSIARQFSRGLSNKEIARASGISPTTVRTHLASTYRKLGISRKQALVALLSDG